MFAQDRDILAIEPSVFRDVAWVGQRLSRGTGTVSSPASGGVLTIAAPDVDLALAGVGAGHVAVVDGAAYEIMERLSGTQVRLSRARALATDPQIPPSPVASGVECWIVTFAPQLALAHRQVLAMAGIDPDSPEPAPGRVGEGHVTNARALARVEALLALHLVYAAAGSAAPEGAPVVRRARELLAMYREERSRARVEVDLNGDGMPDAVRLLNGAVLTRG